MFDWLLNTPLLPVIKKQIILYEKYKTLWPLFMNGVQISQGYRATARKQFTFYQPVSWSFWYSFNQLWQDEKLK